MYIKDFAYMYIIIIFCARYLQKNKTVKDLNQVLGKETIDMYNTGETRGQSQSYNLNYQKLGKE